MNTELATILMGHLSELNWMDKYTGLVRPVTMTQPNPLGTGVIRKTFPVACTISEADCIANNNLTDLAPNTDKRSVAYFEDVGTRFEGVNGRYIHVVSNLKLVVWLNGKKLGYDGCGISAMASLSIFKELIPLMAKPFNEGSFVNIRIKGVSQDVKGPQIFSRYSYDEATTQFLMFPYDYFAMNFLIEYDVPLNCINDFEILDERC